MREHLRTLYAAVEHGFEGATLPAFVRADLEGYVLVYGKSSLEFWHEFAEIHSLKERG